MKEIIKRSPGQSLDEQIEGRLFGKLLLLVVAAAVSVGFAVNEWLRLAINTPPRPIPLTVAAILTGGYAFWQYRRDRFILAQLRLGRDGEREVGQILSEDLPDYDVFHDILCDDFNIDHALIGSAGVFSIETKTRSKRGGPEEKVIYDGEKILVAGIEPDRNALMQAEANAKALSRIILDQTGLTVRVKPVVLFPGWWVENRVKQPKVWVLNPKMLVSWMKNERQSLSSEQIHAIVSGLKRHQQAAVQSR